MASQIPVAQQRQRVRSKRGPGKGLLDWIKLCRSFRTNQQADPDRVITFEELKKHNTEDDCWTAFRGDVYNITYYLSFHPGGNPEIMKAAGIDCTLMFNEVHSHVNLSSILVTFKVGTLATFNPLSSAVTLSHSFLSSGSPKPIRKLNLKMHTMKVTGDNVNCEDVADGVNTPSPVKSIDINRIPPTPTKTVASPLFQAVTNEHKASNNMTTPQNRPRRSSREQRDRPNVKCSWDQTGEDVIIILSGQNLAFNSEDVILKIVDHVLEAKIFLGNWCYTMNIALESPVKNSKVKIIESELQIRLEKDKKEMRWSDLGVLLPGNAEVTPRSNDTLGIQYMNCSLEAAEEINYNSKMFTFKLPGASHMVIPTGHHIRIKAKSQNGEWIERSYTPVLPLVGSYHSEGSEVKLMIKLYSKGAMSSVLSSLHTGDEMQLSLPVGTFNASTLDSASQVILLAAGSGFTPMVKVIRKICMKNRELIGKKTTVKLLFFNRALKDILWWDELQSLSEEDPNFTVEHILSHAGSGWTGSRGRASRLVLEKHMPPVADDQLICLCGPTQFTQLAISNLLDMDYKGSSIHVFE